MWVRIWATCQPLSIHVSPPHQRILTPQYTSQTPLLKQSACENGGRGGATVSGPADVQVGQRENLQTLHSWIFFAKEGMISGSMQMRLFIRWSERDDGLIAR